MNVHGSRGFPRDDQQILRDVCHAAAGVEPFQLELPHATGDFLFADAGNGSRSPKMEHPPRDHHYKSVVRESSQGAERSRPQTLERMIASAEPRTTLAQRGEAVGNRDGDTRCAVDSPRAGQLDFDLNVDVAVDELCEGAARWAR